MIRLENVLKISFQGVLKTSSKHLEDVLNMSWRRFSKTSWRHIEGVLKMSWSRFCKTSWRCIEDVLKTSWRRLEDIWPRRIYWSWLRRLEDVFWKCMAKTNMFVLIKMSSRRLEDVFWRRRRKTSSKRLHQDECLVGNFKIFMVFL